MQTTKQPIKIAITGAAGQISYSLLFKIASGGMLGLDQPVILQLLELESALTALKGVVMELQDCAFPLLHSISFTHDPHIAFLDIDIAILVGSKPRSKGMERSDLLNANGQIFIKQGIALSAVAKKTVKVLVVGNPANTNALITSHYAKNIDPTNITSMMRLDHNRTLTQLAIKTNTTINDIKKVIVWGNHSTTQYPDIFHATVKEQQAHQLISNNYLVDILIPTVQKRGAAVIEARGLSSAASAASSASDHIRNWLYGSGHDDYVTMGVISDGSYGIPHGIICGMPVVCNNGNYTIVQDLHINELSHQYIDVSIKELLQERELIKDLLK